MKEIKNLDEIVSMVGGSLSDVQFCDEDINKIDEDFLTRYPEYSSLNPREKHKSILDKVKVNLILFRKRTYVKTVFIYIEGILFAMKRILLEHKNELKESDIIRLQEYKLVGSNINSLREEHVFINLEQNIKFTFNKYAELRTDNYKVVFNCNEWENFKESINIRNRITHPKHSDDLIISDEELNKVRASHDWFFHILHALKRKEKY